jgi:hypothetical protein
MTTIPSMPFRVSSPSTSSTRLFWRRLFRHSALAFALGLCLLILFSTSAAFAQTIPNPVPPQGRLTLVSYTPVLTSDVVGATTVYYTSYVGDWLPIPGTPQIFSQISLTLEPSIQTAGNIYDIFAVNIVTGDETNFYLCTGPAWENSTTRTAQISQSGGAGLWVNASTLTNCYNGYTNYGGQPAYAALYLGSIYMTANGETSMQFKPAAASGGSASVLGLYNAYNRVRVSSQSIDSTNSWTYAGAAWRASDDSNSNRITFLDGLQQSFIEANFLQASNQTSGIQATIGIQLDATTGGPSGFLGSLVGQSGYLTMNSKNNLDPQLGLHYIQAMEFSSGSTATFYGSGNMLLQIALEM